MIKYKNIVEGKFVDRPNRFIAHVEVNGTVETVHVKNTGRCKELLIQGVTVYLEKSNNPERKTLYDLVAVKKGERLINMDSQIPNAAAFEWVNAGGLGFIPIFSKREVKYGNSRFDIYAEYEDEDKNLHKAFIEVKGVTLENDGVVKFPDAPTIRGLKHIFELSQCIKMEYEGYIIFVIQMSDVKYFTPNYITHEDFGNALKLVLQEGVHIVAVSCDVTIDGIEVSKKVPVKL